MNRAGAVALTTSPLFITSGAFFVMAGWAFWPIYLFMAVVGIYMSVFVCQRDDSPKKLVKQTDSNNEPVSYYDHKTDKVVDYDPTLEIVDDNWHEKLIEPPAKADAVAIDRITQEVKPKPKPQTYGHGRPFLKDLAAKLPKAPDNTKWSLSTEVMKERKVRDTGYRGNVLVHEINDVYATLDLIDAVTKKKLQTAHRENITRTNYWDGFSHDQMTFAEASASEYEFIRERVKENSNDMIKRYVTAATKARVSYEQKVNVPEPESYIV